MESDSYGAERKTRKSDPGAALQEGILARSKQVYRTVSSEDNYYEIMVLGSEAVEAQQLLIENNLLM